MNINRQLLLLAWLCHAWLCVLPTWGQDASAIQPKPIPQGRAAMLIALEKLKQREARLPLGAPAPGSDASGGSLGIVNNGRMRQLYLPPELQIPRPQTPDPAMTLPNDFAVELFWIASRVNNCHYCLGHQEVKLKREGLTEHRLLCLDTDWTQFDLRRQVAFDFARRLTEAPQVISQRDIDQLKVHFSPLEILEMAFLIGRYNATNRWTDSLGIPQEVGRDFATELSPDELARPSTVVGHAPLPRPIPADVDTWKQQLSNHKSRESRLPLIQPNAGGEEDLLPHEALLLNLPVAGKHWLDQWQSAQANSHLPTDLPASLLFVCAIEDGTAYVQHLASEQLRSNGWTDEAIFALLAENAAPEREVALQFARKLTRAPQAMTDGDVEGLRAYYSPPQIAEIVHRVGLAVHLNRLAQTAGFGWD